MPAPSPRPRRWFQIHLSTALILMMVAAILLWANTRATFIFSNMSVEDYTRGWPWEMQWESRPALRVKISPNDPEYARYFGTRTSGKRVAMNAAVAFTILASVAFVSESLIRRREARKP